jgi:hypothetical protein
MKRLSQGKNFIPIEECRNGFLYVIAARNAFLGIYDVKQKGFRISRFKFDRNYEFVEYHWDTGEPYGTAKPYRELFKPKGVKSEKRFLEFMNEYYDKNRKDILEVIKKEDEEYGSILRAKENFIA